MNRFLASQELKEWCIAATPLQLQIRIDRQMKEAHEMTYSRPEMRKIASEALDLFKYCLENYPVTADTYPKSL